MNETHRLALIISLAVISTLTSCKKDNTEKPVVFPLNLYSEKIEVVAATRMFTKAGEIKDRPDAAPFLLVAASCEQVQSDLRHWTVIGHRIRTLAAACSTPVCQAVSVSR